MDINSQRSSPQLLVWWLLWAAFQTGIFFIYFLVPPLAAPRPADEGSMWLLGTIPVLASGFIRWTLLPRATDAQNALVRFVIGVALAEATCFLGIFIFSTHRTELFGLSALGIFQFVPVFARRFVAPGERR